MKRRTLVLVLGALGLVAAAAAVGVTRAGAITMHQEYTGTATRTAAAAAGCQRLMRDPAAMAVMQTLHADHQNDVQAWRAGYGADPTSTEAKKARKALWREHRTEMKAAFKNAGIKLPAGVCTKQMMSAGGMMGTGGAGMMGATDSSGLHELHHGGEAAQASGMTGSAGGAGMMGGTY